MLFTSKDRQTLNTMWAILFKEAASNDVKSLRLDTIEQLLHTIKINTVPDHRLLALLWELVKTKLSLVEKERICTWILKNIAVEQITSYSFILEGCGISTVVAIAEASKQPEQVQKDANS